MTTWKNVGPAARAHGARAAIAVCAAIALAAFALAFSFRAPAYAAELADGTYEVPVTLDGGSGRASLEPTAQVVVDGGSIEATVAFTSQSYDLMVVDGVEYKPTTTDPGSTFSIPVETLSDPLAVSAETVAMGSPHMIDYTITFDASSAQAVAGFSDNGAIAQPEGAVPVAAIVVGVVAVIVIAGAFGIVYFRRKASRGASGHGNGKGGNRAA